MRAGSSGSRGVTAPGGCRGWTTGRPGALELDDAGSGSQWFRPPRLATGEEREASRLEPFHDLAYVLVVAELAASFVKDLTWTGAAGFAALFTAMWMAWVGTTLYDTALLGLTAATTVVLAAVGAYQRRARTDHRADGPGWGAPRSTRTGDCCRTRAPGR